MMILQEPETELRRLRRERGLTLEAVAYLAGVDVATISRIERGLVEPRRETVVRLAHAYKMQSRRLAALVDGSDDG